MSTYYGPDGTDLSDSPQLRSKFQKAIGDQNIELELNRLAADPRVQASIDRMNADLRAGKKEIDPMNAYLHNKLIARLFLDARRQAWKVMMQDHRIQNMIQQEQRRQIAQKKTLKETSSLLQMNR